MSIEIDGRICHIFPKGQSGPALFWGIGAEEQDSPKRMLKLLEQILVKRTGCWLPMNRRIGTGIFPPGPLLRLLVKSASLAEGKRRCVGFLPPVFLMYSFIITLEFARLTVCWEDILFLVCLAYGLFIAAGNLAVWPAALVPCGIQIGNRL